MVKYFRNKDKNEEIRWDAAIYRTAGVLLKGRAGKNHWHRINPESDLNRKYLNRQGEPCSILADESFIPPKNQELKEDHLIAIEQDESTLNKTVKRIIEFFDTQTENWLHDSKIKSITNSNPISLEIIHSRNGKIINSNFNFKNSEISNKEKLLSINGREIYLIKVWSLNESRSRLNFKLEDNSEFQIDFESFEYNEINYKEQ